MCRPTDRALQCLDQRFQSADAYRGRLDPLTEFGGGRAQRLLFRHQRVNALSSLRAGRLQRLAEFRLEGGFARRQRRLRFSQGRLKGRSAALRDIRTDRFAKRHAQCRAGVALFFAGFQRLDVGHGLFERLVCLHVDGRCFSHLCAAKQGSPIGSLIEPR